MLTAAIKHDLTGIFTACFNTADWSMLTAAINHDLPSMFTNCLNTAD